MKAITKSAPASLSVFATAAILALRETGRSSRVVGYGDAPLVPCEKHGFLVSTLESSEKYNLPKEVLKRLAVLDQENIPYTHIITAHEIPKEKPKPKPIEIRGDVVDVTSDVSGVLATVLMGIGGILWLAVEAVVAIVSVVVFVDPIVYVRLASGEWLEIANWYE